MWIRNQDKDCIIYLNRIHIKKPSTWTEGKGDYFLIANDDLAVGKYADHESAKAELDNVMGMLYSDKKMYELN
jgi:hypothetical protein